MTFRYEAFGLGIGSNRPLPGLRQAAAGRPDVSVEFVEDRAPEPDPRAPETMASMGSGSIRRCDDGARVLRFASHRGESAWSMRVSGDGRDIEVSWRGPIELPDITAFVEVTGLSTVLALRGVPLLHGCAVDMGDAAFLVLGEGGAGKSTLAAAAVAGGRALLSDDIAALDGDGPAVRVRPGGCRLRMNADTARALGWDPGRLARVFKTAALPPKLSAPLSTADGSLSAGARRVAAVFVLGERRTGPVRIDRLAPAAALPLVLGNTFGDRLMDARERARLLPFWTRLAREVPVHAVAPPDGLEAAPSVVEALAAVAEPTGRSGRLPYILPRRR